jgi:protein TonB
MKQIFQFCLVLLTANAACAQAKSDTLAGEKARIYHFVESNPDFPGGLPKFFEFIRQNVKLPEDAKSNGIKGKVLVQFTIGPTGDVLPESIKVLRSLYPSCDAEAVRAIGKSPKWLPGRQYGKGVPVKYSVAVTFE